MNQRSIVVMLVVAVALVVGLLISNTPEPALEGSGQPLVPGMMEKLNDVSRIEVTSTESFELVQEAAGWVIPERDDYVAATEAVRDLLLGLASLKRQEAKTKTPSLYAKLGLSEPASEGSEAVGYRLKDNQGHIIASVRLGTRKVALSNPDASQLYVLSGDDPQAWLVEGEIPDHRTLLDFVSEKLIQIERSRIANVSLTHDDGRVVELSRKDSAAESFEVLNATGPIKEDVQWQIDDIGYALAHMTLKGIYPAARVASLSPILQVDLSTFDGLTVNLSAYPAVDGVSKIARLRASLNELSIAASSREELTAEVTRLNERWQRWVFLMSSYEAGKFDYGIEEFLASSVPE